ncbi:hypothetical protein DPMN_095648 [Dreissena polymorpha]|uniref:Uncharacterized protein n=1 Tax=Dreissena polymorpha TaxID=45954 RepID=A0A9D4R2Y8_DREPO|nr:hypothetical protein DPMN_095648 [Dreissena polymorpha]
MTSDGDNCLPSYRRPLSPPRKPPQSGNQVDSTSSHIDEEVQPDLYMNQRIKIDWF